MKKAAYCLLAIMVTQRIRAQETADRLSSNHSLGDSLAVYGSMMIIVFIGAALIYLIPLVIARIRRASHTTSIGLMNIFLGWTIFGWMASLIWACTDETVDQAQLREALYRNAAQHFAQ